MIRGTHIALNAYIKKSIKWVSAYKGPQPGHTLLSRSNLVIQTVGFKRFHYSPWDLA